jgi:hypothetical protein
MINKCRRKTPKTRWCPFCHRKKVMGYSIHQIHLKCFSCNREWRGLDHWKNDFEKEDHKKKSKEEFIASSLERKRRF